jgi:hypothetical protein
MGSLLAQSKQAKLKVEDARFDVDQALAVPMMTGHGGASSGGVEQMARRRADGAAAAVMAMRIMAASGASRWIRPWPRRRGLAVAESIGTAPSSRPTVLPTISAPALSKSR